jgi:hypothetical protein
VPWPIQSGFNWRHAWQRGDNILLQCPWQREVVLSLVLALLAPVLAQQGSLWLLVPDERWLQVLMIRLTGQQLRVACLGAQTTSQQAVQRFHHWQAGQLDVMLLTPDTLSAWVRHGPDRPDCFIGLDPLHWQTVPTQLHCILVDLLHTGPSAWLAPHMPPTLSQRVQTRWGGHYHRATVPINPFHTQLMLYPHSVGQVAPLQVAAQLSVQQPVLWLTPYGTSPLPSEVSRYAQPVTPQQLPFVVQAHSALLVPNGPVPFHQWLSWCLSEVPNTVHIWRTPSSRASGFLHQLGKGCLWQFTMQRWQGISRRRGWWQPPRQACPPVPACGRCPACQGCELAG